jgi:hypothetical protein
MAQINRNHHHATKHLLGYLLPRESAGATTTTPSPTIRLCTAVHRCHSVIYSSTPHRTRSANNGFVLLRSETYRIRQDGCRPRRPLLGDVSPHHGTKYTYPGNRLLGRILLFVKRNREYPSALPVAIGTLANTYRKKIKAGQGLVIRLVPLEQNLADPLSRLPRLKQGQPCPI